MSNWVRISEEAEEHVSFDAPIAEMEDLGDNWKDIVVLDKNAVSEMVKDDEHPEFPVIRVEEGMSNNGRLWPGHILDDIASQINENQPVAHLGHIPAAEQSHSLPDVQTVWLGATTRQEPSKVKGQKGKIVTALYAKGYNLPGAKIRAFLRAKAVNSTSWDGMAVMRPIPGGQGRSEVVKFSLASLDWSRKHKQGMAAALMGVASEMTDNEIEGGTDMSVDLAKVTPAEFKEGNPNAYQLIVAEMTADSDAKIEQLQEQITAAAEDKKLVASLREALGLDEGTDLLEAAGALMEKSKHIVKNTLDKHLGDILSKKIGNEKTRAAVLALLPAAEMEAKIDPDKSDDDNAKLISEMVDEAFDKNDVISGLVSEMGGSGHNVSGRRRSELRDSSAKLSGMTSSRVKL